MKIKINHKSLRLLLLLVVIYSDALGLAPVVGGCGESPAISNTVDGYVPLLVDASGVAQPPLLCQCRC